MTLYEYYMIMLLMISKSYCEKLLEITTKTTTLIGDKVESCRFASLQCSYRSGCGSTLQSYAFECDSLIKNKTTNCSSGCKNTLIGLMSTPEGRRMMNCDCKDDHECIESKVRLRYACSEDSVLYANRKDTIVSCTEAQWICSSDSECAKALEYYHLFCKSMFEGRKCTERCKNSIAILKRQNQAKKLSKCLCHQDQQCENIKLNMKKMCFPNQNNHRQKDHFDPQPDDDNRIENSTSKCTSITSKLLNIHFLLPYFLLLHIINSTAPTTVILI